MRDEIKKITKMIDEVTTFFLHKYKCETLIHILSGKNEHEIRFLFKGLTLDEKTMAKLTKKMKAGRDPSLTSYYWQLTGEMESSDELNLIGMMCDDVQFEQREDGLALTLRRQLLRA